MKDKQEVMQQLDENIKKLDGINVANKMQPDVVAVSAAISTLLVVLEDFENVDEYQKWKRDTALPHEPKTNNSLWKV